MFETVVRIPKPKYLSPNILFIHNVQSLSFIHLSPLRNVISSCCDPGTDHLYKGLSVCWFIGL